MVHWYVMHSKPRKESLLYQQLLLQSIEAYLPSVRTDPVNPRAQKMQPFFPGYLFIHVDLEEISISDLRWMPGAIGLISYGGEPASVTDTLIRAIREQVNHVNVMSRDHENRFTSGDRVLIKDGPFADYKAIFDCRLSGNARVRVFLELLQGQKIRLDLSARQLRPLIQ
jgi:transcription elongation factor/antiterminator RfaH